MLQRGVEDMFLEEVVAACNLEVDTVTLHEGQAIACWVGVDADSHELEGIQHFA